MNFFKNIWGSIKSLFLLLGLIFLLVVGIVLVLFIFKGKLYIEVIIIFVLIYMFLFWKLWFNYSKKKLIKNYNPEEDLGRLAEEEKKKLGGSILQYTKREEIYNGKNKSRTGGTEQRDSTTATADTSSIGLGESEERELLPKTNVDSARKNRSGIRKILGRRRRK